MGLSYLYALSGKRLEFTSGKDRERMYAATWIERNVYDDKVRLIYRLFDGEFRSFVDGEPVHLTAVPDSTAVTAEDGTVYNTAEAAFEEIRKWLNSIGSSPNIHYSMRVIGDNERIPCVKEAQQIWSDYCELRDGLCGDYRMGLGITLSEMHRENVGYTHAFHNNAIDICHELDEFLIESHAITTALQRISAGHPHDTDTPMWRGEKDRAEQLNSWYMTKGLQLDSLTPAQRNSRRGFLGKTPEQRAEAFYASLPLPEPENAYWEISQWEGFVSEQLDATCEALRLDNPFTTGDGDQYSKIEREFRDLVWDRYWVWRVVQQAKALEKQTSFSPTVHLMRATYFGIPLEQRARDDMNLTSDQLLRKYEALSLNPAEHQRELSTRMGLISNMQIKPECLTPEQKWIKASAKQKAVIWKSLSDEQKKQLAEYFLLSKRAQARFEGIDVRKKRGGLTWKDSRVN